MHSQHSDQWAQLVAEDSCTLETHRARWLASDNPQDGGSVVQVSMGHHLFNISFADMTQTHIATGIRRRLRRVQALATSRVECEPEKPITIFKKKLEVAQAETVAALEAGKEAQAQVDRLKSQLLVEQLEVQINTREALAERRFELHKVSAAARKALDDSLQLHLKELEIWKQQATRARVSFHEQPGLTTLLQSTLRQLVPAGHHGECARGNEAIVTSVRAVANFQLWKQYLAKRDLVRDSIRCHQACPWIQHVAPTVETVAQLFP